MSFSYNISTLISYILQSIVQSLIHSYIELVNHSQTKMDFSIVTHTVCIMKVVFATTLVLQCIIHYIPNVRKQIKL